MATVTVWTMVVHNVPPERPPLPGEPPYSSCRRFECRKRNQLIKELISLIKGWKSDSGIYRIEISRKKVEERNAGEDHEYAMAA